jgi:hypothetical protein
MQKTHDRELSKVFDFLKIALRTGLVFLVFHINIFKNDIFVNFAFVFIYFGLKIKLLVKFFSIHPSLYTHVFQMG